MVDIKGDYEIEAPCELVWDMVLDPEVLSRIMPGCERLEKTGENEYQGKMRIQVGPVDGVFQGTLALSDVRPLEGFHMQVNGRGPSGMIRGEGNLEMQPLGSGTKLMYEGTSQVSGRMATVGQR
ncbi:MAG: carbon monoxide dehydrogenase subunit G, partial [Candidatus Promineifilaceae bacterium]|nr:carbon monoxide dehydrogenase subunit G [Candidatus Promineifilaceae bacterium]